ncbi:FAD/NAD(P)-binding domain-containing protein [Penicillium chermesinum]|uniref:FAD/NAD(P)-binding domain-containing protein n=1 Tax=Penicillium chermesinum TaxID=63820 RepID=A0A9W9TJQ9_9EURO|nr:FAD/NAD(P)-binding domain-containing protein [Penicillium chermesinum]KAJ5225377.1 FAD/NAD(P)-binding domain-containing protein [Penicillium chermesinum]
MLRKIIRALFFFGAVVPLGECKDTIVRDVAIIGGGASGTFAAVRLRDKGQSVILIEKEDILGGHVNTYHDAATNQTVDYGVVIYHNLQIVKDFFNRLGVSWTLSSFDSSSPETRWLDPKTADPVNYTSPNPASGIQAYAAHLSQYPSIEQGFFLPEPVPEDLLLPFGQYLAKYPEIQSAAQVIFNFAQGLGDFLHQTTLYVFKNFGTDIIKDTEGGFIVADNGNDDIYKHATELLGSDVLLGSKVVSIKSRNKTGIDLIVQTTKGYETIKAKKLLISIPQKLENLRPFALDQKESALFGQFKNTGYYTSLVNNTGLPAGFVSFSVSADTPYHIPKLPGIYSIQATAVPGLFDIKYGSPGTLSDQYVQKEILAYIAKLQANGIANKTSNKPQFSPKDSIAKGFYKDLYALQGYRNTWYTGAAFDTQDSSLLWSYTETSVLPLLLNSSS